MVPLDCYRKIFPSLILLLFLLLLIIPAGMSVAATVDELIVNLHSHDLQVQLSAVEELGRMKDSKAVDALLNFVFIKAENWRVKIKAIRLLGEIPDQIITDKLVTFLMTLS